MPASICCSTRIWSRRAASATRLFVVVIVVIVIVIIVIGDGGVAVGIWGLAPAEIVLKDPANNFI